MEHTLQPSAFLFLGSPCYVEISGKRAMSTSDQELLDRLSAHGIDPAHYYKIKRLVALSFPQGRYRFFRQFGKRRIDQVLRQIDQARAFLAKDFLLSDEVKKQVEKFISIAEMLAWDALLEINSGKVGPWMMRSAYVPTGTDKRGRPKYLYPSLLIVAIHMESKERRAGGIPGEVLKDFSNRAKAWKHTYEQLGIWDLVYRGSVHKGVVSAREPQGWAVFTKEIIPRLYEHLLPYYRKQGHYSQQRDNVESGKVQFPKELFEDMLLILRIEHPGFFDRTSVHQLKSVIQRFLQSRRESTELPKTPQKREKVLPLQSHNPVAL
jgi:hypothetical protein